jgi:hypothetical protein
MNGLSKPIEFSPHVREKMRDRGASEGEVEAAIRMGNPEPARKGRILFGRTSPSTATGEGSFMPSSKSLLC